MRWTFTKKKDFTSFGRPANRTQYRTYLHHSLQMCKVYGFVLALQWVQLLRVGQFGCVCSLFGIVLIPEGVCTTPSVTPTLLSIFDISPMFGTPLA